MDCGFQRFQHLLRYHLDQLCSSGVARPTCARQVFDRIACNAHPQLPSIQRRPIQALTIHGSSWFRAKRINRMLEGLMSAVHALARLARALRGRLSNAQCALRSGSCTRRVAEHVGQHGHRRSEKSGRLFGAARDHADQSTTFPRFQCVSTMAIFIS